MIEYFLSIVRLQAEIQRNILQDIAGRSKPGSDRVGYLTRAQCLDDLITVLRHSETEYNKQAKGKL